MKTRFEVVRCDDREDMGRRAARDAERCIKRILDKKEYANVIFAAAPSQNELLENLAKSTQIDFTRVNAFHMDEYVGLSPEAPQGFGNFLKRALFSRVAFRTVNYIDISAEDPARECARYAALLMDNLPDVVCMGIGENAHIAFNDPAVADFADREAVKVVELDSVCRAQQVNDGCFKSIEEVPTHAITLTIPTLAKARYHICVVPAATKAEAVYNTVCGPICEQYPATSMRLMRSAAMYIEPQSAAKLPECFR